MLRSENGQNLRGFCPRICDLGCQKRCDTPKIVTWLNFRTLRIREKNVRFLLIFQLARAAHAPFGRGRESSGRPGNSASRGTRFESEKWHFWTFVCYLHVFCLRMSMLTGGFGDNFEDANIRNLLKKISTRGHSQIKISRETTARLDALWWFQDHFGETNTRNLLNKISKTTAR